MLFEALSKAGVDPKTGLYFCQGDVEMYKSILSEYCTEKKSKFINLVDCYEKRDWKNYEILVDCSLGSAEGSGAATWGHRYFFVPDKGGMVTPETFLGMMGYDRESFLAAADADEYYTDYSESKMTEDFSYEELLGMFYFDQNAELIFVPDLMF